MYDLIHSSQKGRDDKDKLEFSRQDVENVEDGDFHSSPFTNIVSLFGSKYNQSFYKHTHHNNQNTGEHARRNTELF